MPELPITRRRLGSTDIEVTPIGLGVMQFSGPRSMFRWIFNDLTQETMNAIVQAALDGGINWFDTAEMYGRGHSERSLARALKAAGVKEADAIVATKWSPFLRSARNIPRSISDRIRLLEGYAIDLYYVHQPWGFSPPEVEMDAMAKLVEAGKIRSVGVSNFNVNQMRRAHSALGKRGLPLAANQVQYSLLNRKIETSGLLEAAKELGVTIVAWGPLASGLLTGKYHRDPALLDRTPLGRRMQLRRGMERSRGVVQALKEIASDYDVTPAQIALNWLIHGHDGAVVAIPGASQIHQSVESAGAMRFRLSEAEMARLDEVSRPFR